jgi:hypothetical protein
MKKMNKAAKIRRLLRKGLTTKEISVEVGCTYNYVCVIRAAMKPKKAMPVPPAELGLASLTPDPAMNAYAAQNAAYEGQGRKVSAYRKAKIVEQIAARRAHIDKRHQLIERFAKGVLYVAAAGVCVAIAYVVTL